MTNLAVPPEEGCETFVFSFEVSSGQKIDIFETSLVKMHRGSMVTVLSTLNYFLLQQSQRLPMINGSHREYIKRFFNCQAFPSRTIPGTSSAQDYTFLYLDFAISIKHKFVIQLVLIHRKTELVLEQGAQSHCTVQQPRTRPRQIQVACCAWLQLPPWFG